MHSLGAANTCSAAASGTVQPRGLVTAWAPAARRVFRAWPASGGGLCHGHLCACAHAHVNVCRVSCCCESRCKWLHLTASLLLQGALDKEDARTNRVLVQPIALLPGTQHGSAAEVVARLGKLRFTAEYFGISAGAINLDLSASSTDRNAGGRGLSCAAGSAPALELCLGSLHGGDGSGEGPDALAAAEFLHHLRSHALRVDVWDAEAGFALGSVQVGGLARVARQGREVVYLYEICPFVEPLGADDGSPGPSPLAASTHTKQVEVPGMECGASIALRVICVANDLPADAHTTAAGGILHEHKLGQHGYGTGGAMRIPLKLRNSDVASEFRSFDGGGGVGLGASSVQGGGKGEVDTMLNLSAGVGASGWHRVRAQQSALPQRAALALVFVNRSVAVCCSLLQSVAVCCSVVQSVAVCCSCYDVWRVIPQDIHWCVLQ